MIQRDFYLRGNGFLLEAADGKPFTGFAAVFQALVIILCFTAGTALIMWLGEQINEDTALIHLEKADTNFTGAYPAVNQLFIENYFSHTKFINREEDMGIEGLRKAKLSYRPAYLLEKFTAVEAE